MNPCQVYNYSHYADYLKNVIEWHKEQGKPLSHQYLMNKLGLNSKVQVYRILQGERKRLPEDIIHKLDQILKHNSREMEYFHLLIKFNEAKEGEIKDQIYQKLHKLLRPISSYRPTHSEMEYVSNWYTPVIRELITSSQFNSNHIGKMLFPPVPEKEVQKSINLMQKLGFISKAENGNWQLREKHLDMGRGPVKIAADNYQFQQLSLAQKSLPYAGKQPHRTATATFGINAEGLKHLMKALDSFQKKVVDIVSEYDAEKDQVYQLNWQLFPVSKKIEGDKDENQ